MLYPSINLLRTKVDSRYTLVMMAAKRARDLVEGKPKLTLMESNTPFSIATFEISDDLISYKRPENGEAVEAGELEAAGTGEEEAVEAALEAEDGEEAVEAEEEAAEAVAEEEAGEGPAEETAGEEA